MLKMEALFIGLWGWGFLMACKIRKLLLHASELYYNHLVGRQTLTSVGKTYCEL